jgi:hypothetical protein
MLPTEDETNICIGGDKLVYIAKSSYSLSHIKSQHLYIVSDEELKDGDWFYSTLNDHQKKIQQRRGDWRTCFNEHKIVATTNTKLTLFDDNEIGENIESKIIYIPRIPQSFLKLYCEQGGIDEVDLERENGYVNNRPVSNSKLKLTLNNEVIVKPIKENL